MMQQRKAAQGIQVLGAQWSGGKCSVGWLGRGALAGRGLPARDRAANQRRARGGPASVSCWDGGIRTKISSTPGGLQRVLGVCHVGPLSAYPVVGPGVSDPGALTGLGW
jgi:hypothetical protein